MKNLYFDIEKKAKESRIPADVLIKIKAEAKIEFQNDLMMYELHVLRAIKSRFWEKLPSSNRNKELARS